MVKIISTAEARANLGDVLNGVYYTKEPVIVQKKGKTVAMIISPDEYEAFRRDRDARAWATVEAIGAHHAGEDPDAVLAEVSAVVEEVRRERYEQRPLNTVVDTNLFVSALIGAPGVPSPSVTAHSSRRCEGVRL